MYSNLKNVQYLIAGLKAYGINKVVVSPGNSHNAIVRSMEEDDFFKTYNIVDERSAAFFACGLCQELQETIAICCTAGTAASNYLTGITEASRRGLPIVVITGDKNPYYLAQYEDQMIENMSIFSQVTRHGCKLPIIENEKDAWYCQRIINETLLELHHHGSGPVHIDVPIEQGMMAIGEWFTTSELPTFTKIDRYSTRTQATALKSLFESLYGKKVFILCGQDDHISKKETDLIESISRKYRCVFGTDKISNLHCKGTVEVTGIVKTYSNKMHDLLPDIVISIAGNPCMEFKFTLRANKPMKEHWIVNESGTIADPFRRLSTVFEGTTLDFLEAMDMYGEEGIKNDYLDKWEKAKVDVKKTEFEYSNLYAVQKVMERMPTNSNFNIANSTTIRIAQYFDLDETIQVYCNRGVNGIDGCVSTFVGQAAANPDKLNFLIVGDLTFFYDMNAIWNRYIGNNIRIMLNNNEGAALFHFNQGTKNYPTLNENVAAEHYATAKGWVESQGFKYLKASNKEEFDECLDEFFLESDAPVFFEVFTHKDKDAELQHLFYDSLPIVDSSVKAKQIIKSIVGQDMIDIIKGRKRK